MSSTLALCLLATILSSTTCQPLVTRKATDNTEINTSYRDSQYFKERSQTDSDYLNSVYYDNKSFGGPSDTTSVSASEETRIPSSFQVVGQDGEIGNTELYNRYRYNYDAEQPRQEQTAASASRTENQEKLFEALRELAFALKAIETKRLREQREQQTTTTESAPLRVEYDVKSQQFPNLPPFAPELYPKAKAGPLSILEELSGSAGSLW